MKFLAPLMLVVVVVACGDSNSAGPDAGPDATERTCDQGVTYTTPNQPPCTWEWTCSDFSGSLPQYSAECVAGTGSDVTCECRQSGAVSGAMVLADGCSTVTDACEAANAACGFAIPIDCPL